eukprot:SAG31_NODE_41219_length_277_cov_0.584270_1_plen_33_part_10
MLRTHLLCGVSGLEHLAVAVAKWHAHPPPLLAL